MKVVSNAPDRARQDDDPAIPSPPWPRWVLALGAAALVAGVVLRFVTTSDLWLDEALSVNVASLPLDQLHEALKQDGAPPLYYVLLHGWMEIFGTGDFAVRAFSGVVSVLTIPAIWFAARRVGRRAGSAGYLVAPAAVLLLATSPYAIRYATETRMYALQMLLVVLGYLALVRALEQPTLGRLAIVAVLTGSLLYTQYWSMYLVAVVGIGVLWSAWKATDPADRQAARSVVVALVAGGLTFLPWVPTFLYQSANTGTPWGDPIFPSTGLGITVADFGGGDHSEAVLLIPFLLALAVLGVFATATDRFRLDVDVRTRPGVRVEALAFIAALALGLAASFVAGTAFQGRYAAMVFPLFVLVMAFGVRAFADRTVAVIAIGVVCAIGLVGGVRNVVENRTQAEQSAEIINAEAQAGDIVVYCPDQVGPDVSRLVDVDGLEQITFPDGDRPELIDWVDYEERAREGDPRRFANQVVEAAGDSTIWYVNAPGYRNFVGTCEAIAGALGEQRPGAQRVVADDKFFEFQGLIEYPAP
jgi:hypothetical protein